MGFLKVFKTKTAITSLAMTGLGGVKAATGEGGADLILEGLGLIFLRRGIQKGADNEKQG